jgi:hypothetical protein
MPLELPNLDDRTYNDLLKEALSLIPTYAPDWTNHNPSDPGIALIELFAYLTEMLLYRLNRVTDDNILTFLTLLNGPGWQPKQDLQEEVRLTVLQLRSRYRAVTQEDYQLLSTEDFNAWLIQNQPNLGLIQRAHCVVERNLEMNQEVDRRQIFPGHVSVVILPADGAIAANELGPQPTADQRQALWNYLDERRTLTTRLHVVGPTYAPVSAEILVARYPDVLDDDLRRQIIQAITQFLSPLPIKDIPNHQGGIFGRDVYVSEFYELLEKLDGVDYLPDILLTSQCQAQDNNCVVAESIWNDEGDQIGLRLYDHHLPATRLKLADPNEVNKIVIVSSENFHVVTLAIALTAVPNTDIPDLKQRIKDAVRTFLQPLRRQPTPSNANPTRISQVTQNNTLQIRLTQLEVISLNPIQYRELNSQTLDLGTVTGVQKVNSIDLPTNGIIIEPKEVIELRLQVQVQGG